MKLLKPLYGIAEAGLHWFATYFKHQVEKLLLETSKYDPCLLVNSSDKLFAVLGMQTDDTLILADDKWSTLEENELKNAKFRAKPKTMLSPDMPLIFNGYVVTQKENEVMLHQKGQAKKLKLVDSESPRMCQDNVEQRARAAYISLICQPEATFDLSTAAQHKEPDKSNLIALNKRIKWQI